MRLYLLGGVIAAVLVAAGIYLVSTSGSPVPGQVVAPLEGTLSESEQETLPTGAINFIQHGTITKDYPDLKPGVWYLFFEEGEEEYAAELVFDEESICGSAVASGTCKPSVFIQGRGASVKGELVNDTTAVYVTYITFEPLEQQ